MEVHEIEVVIDAKGEVRIQVRDMKGESCLLATKDLERLLGGEIVERTRTGDDDPEEGREREKDRDRLGH
jgi:hypothetical protein